MISHRFLSVCVDVLFALLDDVHSICNTVSAEAVNLAALADVPAVFVPL